MKRKQNIVSGSRYAHLEPLENRILFSGGLDPTFGTGGYVVGRAAPAIAFYDDTGAALQSDGKLLFASNKHLGNGPATLEVRRYLTNGQLDTTFGIGGVATLGSGELNISKIAETASGKVVLINGELLYQLTPAGKLDTSFGNNGKVSLTALMYPSGLAVEGNQILISGSTIPTSTDSGLILRFHSDGTLDQTFGSHGAITVPAADGFFNQFNHIFVTPSGEIAAEDNTFSDVIDNVNSSIVYLFQRNGKIDATFGTGGSYSSDPTVVLQAIAPDGSLIISTFASKVSVGAGVNSNLSRLTPDGVPSQQNFFTGLVDKVAVEPDGTVLVGAGFDPESVAFEVTQVPSNAVTSIPAISSHDVSEILPVASGGYIVVDGFSFSIAKISTTGNPDLSFGDHGLIKPAAPATPPEFYTVATQSDRKVVVGGAAFNGTHEVFDLTRYNVNGTLDTTFGTNGVAETQIGSQDVQTFRELLVQPDGKIVAAGDLGSSVNSFPVTGFAVVRYNSNGSLDKTFGNAGVITFGGDQNPNLLWQSGKLLVGSQNTVRRLTRHRRH